MPQNTPKYVLKDYRGVGGRAHLPPIPEALTAGHPTLAGHLTIVKLPTMAGNTLGVSSGQSSLHQKPNRDPRREVNLYCRLHQRAHNL